MRERIGVSMNCGKLWFDVGEPIAESAREFDDTTVAESLVLLCGASWLASAGHKSLQLDICGA